ncbi:hypothetical protein DV735_g4659, partial [Chaetothyriales sp. CBS 134920]
MILDPQGALVWTDTQFKEPFNLDIREYKGEPHLTFWDGKKLGASGNGINYILNSSYHIVKVVKAGNGLEADLHEFNLLSSSNTALLDTYFTREADLSKIDGGSKDGWVWDSGFQEIDLETDTVLFDWRALDHIDVEKTYAKLDIANDDGKKASNAFDWFHINSIDKDGQGNYLISSRHLHALFCINGVTGNVMWQLGGKGNMFRDLTDSSAYPGKPSPTEIKWQHHARWHDNDTSITVFNNNGETATATSIGMWFDIDPVARTVRTRGVYTSPSNAFGQFQGSMSVLPNSHVLLGFGSAAQSSEFTADGTPICDIRFGPRKEFNTGSAENYRAIRGHWVGRPDTNPDVVLEPDVISQNMWMYMSWMGATEVRNWRLEAKSGEGAEEAVLVLATIPKEGFETTIDLSCLGVIAATSGQHSQAQVRAMSKRSAHQSANKHLHQNPTRNQGQHSVKFFRAVALDANNTVLGTSTWVDAGDQLTLDPSASSISASLLSSYSDSSTTATANKLKQAAFVTVAAVILILIGLLPVFWFVVSWVRKRNSDKIVAYEPVSETDKTDA